MNTEVTTRYGRQVKKPVRYEPVEVCTDDYTDESDTEEIESETDEEESDTDSDADEHGNLSNFVTYDDEEDEENVY